MICKCGINQAAKDCPEKACNNCCFDKSCVRHKHGKTHRKQKLTKNPQKEIEFRELVELDAYEYGDFLHDLEATQFSKLPIELNSLIGEFANMEYQKQCGGCFRYVNYEEDDCLFCNNCDKLFCSGCSHFCTIQYKCERNNCWYCKNGQCSNNFSEEFCDKCWAEEDLEAKTRPYERFWNNNDDYEFIDSDDESVDSAK